MTDKQKYVNRIITTADGSHTIYVPELDEHYHSIHGAIQESEHIFIKGGFELCRSDHLHIFEAGFGTGLNAMLTAMRSLNGEGEIFYTAIEKYPLDKSTLESLNYGMLTGKEGEIIFNLIHNSGWGQMNRICRNFSLMKVRGDLVTDELAGSYGLIYFDAFGPQKQPEMWTKSVFNKIAGITDRNGVFVTYSSKGEVKRNLRDCGFKVTLLQGPPGKRHFIKAIKI
jgi:tRNA U34 5-methylaminomethyl-2-thiouridine-forming methyltransferase MnmC